jgi:hypothetical protein
MAKAKVYGFSPWVDQVDAITQIMKETGERTESAVLRKLIDEALTERRRKNQLLPLAGESDNEFGDRLQTIESLLMRLVHRGDTSLRVQDVCLVLLQEVLAETHAIHKISWEFTAVPRLREEGIEVSELDRRFVIRLDRAKDHAYGVAERIKDSQAPLKQKS